MALVLCGCGLASGPARFSSSPSPSVFSGPCHAMSSCWDCSSSLKTLPPPALRLRSPGVASVSVPTPSPALLSHVFISPFTLSLIDPIHVHGHFHSMALTACHTGNLLFILSTQTSRLLVVSTCMFCGSRRTWFLFSPQNHFSSAFLHLGE